MTSDQGGPATARRRAARSGLLGLAAGLAVAGAALPSSALAQPVSTPPDGEITVQKVLVGDSFLADDIEIRVQ